jgi:hydrogenase maturation protease
LQGKVPETVCLLECETVPESYILDIEQFQPTHVLLIDAAFLELKPGDAQLVDAERMMDYSAVSTHALPLRIFCEHVKKTTGAKVGLLLIEPADMEFGEGLSVEVEAASERLTKVLLEFLVPRPLLFKTQLALSFALPIVPLFFLLIFVFKCASSVVQFQSENLCSMNKHIFTCLWFIGFSKICSVPALEQFVP